MDTSSIKILRAEAQEAGDHMQAAICYLALWGLVPGRVMRGMTGTQRSSLADRYGVGSNGRTDDVTAQARAETDCLTVIEEANRE
jgi:hypothetical protein